MCVGVVVVEKEFHEEFCFFSGWGEAIFWGRCFWLMRKTTLEIVTGRGIGFFSIYPSFPLQKLWILVFWRCMSCRKLNEIEPRLRNIIIKVSTGTNSSYNIPIPSLSSRPLCLTILFDTYSFDRSLINNNLDPVFSCYFAFMKSRLLAVDVWVDSLAEIL